jgi:hypothetical protein
MIQPYALILFFLHAFAFSVMTGHTMAGCGMLVPWVRQGEYGVCVAKR